MRDVSVIKHLGGLECIVLLKELWDSLMIEAGTLLEIHEGENTILLKKQK